MRTQRNIALIVALLLVMLFPMFLIIQSLIPRPVVEKEVPIFIEEEIEEERDLMMSSRNIIKDKNFTSYTNITYITTYTKINISYFSFNNNWSILRNFTVFIEFDTNISIDSKMYLYECLVIWNFEINDWDIIDIFTITGSFLYNETFYSKDYLNKSSEIITNIKIGIFTSNTNNDYEFNSNSFSNAWFKNESIIYPPENFVGINYNNIINFSSIYLGNVYMNGLEGYWKFNGNADDYSDNNDGTVFGGASFVDGILDQAIYYDGVNDYTRMNLPDLFDDNNIRTMDHTIAFWFNASDITTDYATLFDATDDRRDFSRFYIASDDGILTYVVRDNNVFRAERVDSSISLNEWYFVVGNWDSSLNDLDLYLNGMIQTTTSSDYPGTSYSDYMTVGKRTSSSFPYWFNGIIDEVMIWNRSLSQEEITNLYNDGYGKELDEFAEIIYTKSNISDFGINVNWTTLQNFTIDIDFTTNVTLDSNLYQNAGITIWNFNLSSWEVLEPITITESFEFEDTLYSNEYFNKSSYNETNIRIGIWTSNDDYDYEFNLYITCSGWFKNESLEFKPEFEVGNNYKNEIYFDIDTEIIIQQDFDKIITATILFESSWIDIDFIAISYDLIINIPITSSRYINKGVSVWNVRYSRWDYIDNITIQNSGEGYLELYPSMDYLTKFDEDDTEVKIKFSSSNEVNYVFDVNLEVISWELE